MFAYDGQQGRDSRPHGTFGSKFSEFLEVNRVLLHCAKNVHNVCQANVVVAIHPLERGNDDPVLWNGNRQKKVAESVVHPPRQYPFGQFFLLTSLSETADMDF